MNRTTPRPAIAAIIGIALLTLSSTPAENGANDGDVPQIQSQIDQTSGILTLTWEDDDGSLQYLDGKAPQEGWKAHQSGDESPVVHPIGSDDSAWLFRVEAATPRDFAFQTEVKVSDGALYFDGQRVEQNRESYVNQGPRYDYAFGRRITPHGDCIARFGDYVFLTWYRGPKSDRHVMLSRYNLKTGSLKTIEFAHRHTGFQNDPNLGESHNTIAVGICEITQSIHLLYDMHAYTPTRPADGSLANDYFRYQFSANGAATVPDDQFDVSLFGAKQLYLKQGESYTGLTYPDFFNNEQGELFVKLRVGGHNNGSYVFAKFESVDLQTPGAWTSWRKFNERTQSRLGLPYNWGLYGSMKFEGGRLAVGFHTRKSLSNDPFRLNNGFYYAETFDPDGFTGWTNASGQAITMPLIDPEETFLDEPGDVFPGPHGKDEVSMSSDADWTVTDRGDLHFRTRVTKGRTSREVHTYRGAGETEFTTVTDTFPGGSLKSHGNYVYLLNLEDRRPVVYRAEGGTNNWEELYRSDSGRSFRHGNTRVYDDYLIYYAMEQKSGSSQPIYLQVFEMPR